MFEKSKCIFTVGSRASEATPGVFHRVELGFRGNSDCWLFICIKQFQRGSLSVFT